MPSRIRDSLRHPGPSLAARAGALREWVVALPWWAHVVLVYAAGRLYSTVVLTAAARGQVPSPWAPGSPSYEEFVNFWDSGWYARIHDAGYPVELPRGDDGTVLENQWAFYPLFPASVRLFSQMTGAGWNPGSTLLAAGYGYVAALIIYRIFLLRASHRDALWAVGVLAFLPVSPILQIPYAEPLHLMLLALSLYLVVTRRYLLAVPAVVLMCLARPAGVPFAVMLGLLVVVNLMGWFTAAERERTSRRTLVRLVVLTATSCVSALAWPAVAWAVTGVPDAYVQTETVWRGSELALFQPWLNVAHQLLGPVLGPAALVVLVAGFAGILLSPAGCRLGVPLQLWCVAYVLYLAAFWNPQTSTFRILLPLFPLILAGVLLSESRAYRWLAVASCACLQVVWVVWLWGWVPLFGGGDYSP
jgi:hypothetical protein